MSLKYFEEAIYQWMRDARFLRENITVCASVFFWPLNLILVFRDYYSPYSIRYSLMQNVLRQRHPFIMQMQT
uniref:Uncharacterized protein n=1 Tax=Heterorhabditis bacteriophora TaxID=37862 RepID=A0A1I7WY05_HETBA